MQYAALIRQILDMSKKTFDNSLNVMVAFQQQSEKMFIDLLEKSSSVPEEGKNAIGDWINHYKKGLVEYQDVVEKQFKWIEDHLLNMVDQMESSFNTVVEKTAAVNSEDQVTKKASVKSDKTAAAKKTVAGGKATAKKKSVNK